MSWDREQEPEHFCVSAIIQTLKAIVLADGRKSCAAPAAGHVLHWVPSCHLNSRAFLLPPCWSALLKQNLWKVNKNNTRDNHLDLQYCHCIVPVEILLLPTEKHGGEQHCKLQLHLNSLCRSASKEGTASHTALKGITTETTPDKVGLFIWAVCTCIGEYIEKCTINTI